jgi:hypothetical protein
MDSTGYVVLTLTLALVLVLVSVGAVQALCCVCGIMRVVLTLYANATQSPLRPSTRTYLYSILPGTFACTAR